MIFDGIYKIYHVKFIINWLNFLQWVIGGERGERKSLKLLRKELPGEHNFMMLTVSMWVKMTNNFSEFITSETIKENLKQMKSQTH